MDRQGEVRWGKGRGEEGEEKKKNVKKERKNFRGNISFYT